jgi:hypothetical protein
VGEIDGSVEVMNTLRFHLEGDEHEDGDYHSDAYLYADHILVNERWSIDWIALTKSVFLPRNYFILTCGCGVAACARLDEPIRVSHEGDIIGWHIIAPPPERSFEFERQQYRTAILEFLKGVKMIVPDSEDSMEYGFGYFGFVGSDLDWCIKTLESGVVTDITEEDIE